MNDNLTCPLCNKSGLKRLRQHITRSHDDYTLEKFLNEFPNTKLVSDSHSEKMRDVALKRSSESRSESSKKMWENSDFRETMSLKTKKQWEDDDFRKMKTENSRENMIKLNSNPEFKLRNGKLSSERMKNKHKDPEFKEKMRKVSSINGTNNLNKLWENEEMREIFLKNSRKNSRGTKIKHKLPNNTSVILRSKLEKSVALTLDSFKIYYDYESVKIPYFINNKKHRYYPDFILKDKTIIEVKPKNLVDDLIVQAKRDGAIDLGYTVYFVTHEDDLNEIIPLIN